MRKESLEFLKAIVDEPSPSGYEEGAAELFRQYTKPFAEEVRTDSHGNLYAILNPKAEMKIMLSGHMDEIGFVVHYISPEGLLYFSPVGGHDSAIVVGHKGFGSMEKIEFLALLDGKRFTYCKMMSAKRSPS